MVLAAPSGVVKWLFWPIAIASAGCLLWALIKVLGVRRAQSQLGPEETAPTASGSLALDPDHESDPSSRGHVETAWIVFKKTYDAFTDLQLRNARRKYDVDGAQIRLFWAIGLLTISLVMGVWIDYTAKQGSASDDDKSVIHSGE